MNDTIYSAKIDSILRREVAEDFNKAIKYSYTYDYFYYCDSTYGIISLYSENKEKELQGRQALYKFFNSRGTGYGYGEFRENFHSYSPLGISIKFDSNGDFIDTLNLDLFRKVYLYYDTDILSLDEAEKIAEQNKTFKSRKTKSNLLIYDIISDRLIWITRREKGFISVEIEEFYIDAVEGSLIQKRSYSFHKRNFFKALGDRIFGTVDL